MFDKKWEDLTILDNFVFLKVFINEEICRKFLSYLLGINIKKLKFRKEPEIEKTIDSFLNSKSIRLDVYCETETESFDIEMQTYNRKEDDLPLRARSYQSNIDQIVLKKGQHYEKLKQLFIIFICSFDYIKENRSVYIIKNSVIGLPNSEIWDDKVTKILLNINGKRENIDKNIGSFLDFCKGLPPVGDFTQAVAKEVEKVKENEKYKEEFMTLAQEIERMKKKWIAEAEEKGREDQRKEDIRRLSSQGKTIEEISSIFDVNTDYVKRKLEI